MAKPICVIYVDQRHLHLGGKVSIRDILTVMEKRLPDYHVLTLVSTVYSEEAQSIELKVFYEKDFTEIQYQELRKMVEDSISKINSTENA